MYTIKSLSFYVNESNKYINKSTIFKIGKKIPSIKWNVSRKIIITGATPAGDAFTTHSEDETNMTRRISERAATT
jgi:hypothetical protein